jgi:hypothetical protein
MPRIYETIKPYPEKLFGILSYYFIMEVIKGWEIRKTKRWRE